MKVLIFGGTGFVGKYLTKELLENGYQVFVVTRNSHKMVSTLGSGVEAIEWDNMSSLSSLKNLEQIDVVINLAGESIGNRRWTPSVKEEIIASRLRTTGAIVTAIDHGVIQPKVFINASAVGYYGPRGDEELAESEEAGKDFLAQVCREWEQEAYKAQAPLTRVVTLRIGVVLGNEGALNRMTMPFKFYIGGPLGTGEQWLSWIHIQDLISIIRCVIEHPGLSGPINAVAPNPARMRDFSKTLGKVLSKPSWLPVPEILLKIALGQMSEMLLHGQRAVPKKIQSAGFEYMYADLEEALENALAVI
ncbi:TIGR01777 family protein [Desulfitobacterium dehalogenans ATCC 51507]|uniref:TIGR01777 family protein n=1 Tax=Desulfitobacterium dehalogenans (strain ATCC 51507 / DSM 9161 / JW/IU-DC1) TaxID=756499 RepID=I4A6M7_DESDJ|nr:TIGR01777 family oxidoreductase [Desulfitobacterium dehalogenans]AFL99611.1 TIGR01777 family protein [Desulfitobacterium dehalogenans ATCC 51507]